MSEVAKRGMLTEAVQEKARALLGGEISQTELRLIPYVQYLLVNQQRLDPNKVNDKERAILSRWREKGFLEGGAGSPLCVSEAFWKAMNEILWVGYVNFDGSAIPD